MSVLIALRFTNRVRLPMFQCLKIQPDADILELHLPWSHKSYTSSHCSDTQYKHRKSGKMLSILYQKQYTDSFWTLLME
jgi:hypothetical protein